MFHVEHILFNYLSFLNISNICTQYLSHFMVFHRVRNFTSIFCIFSMKIHITFSKFFITKLNTRMDNKTMNAITPDIIISRGIILLFFLAIFSLFCIYVTFFATWLDAIRLSSFMGSIVLIGFLIYVNLNCIEQILFSH